MLYEGRGLVLKIGQPAFHEGRGLVLKIGQPALYEGRGLVLKIGQPALYEGRVLVLDSLRSVKEECQKPRLGVYDRRNVLKIGQPAF